MLLVNETLYQLSYTPTGSWNQRFTLLFPEARTRDCSRNCNLANFSQVKHSKSQTGTFERVAECLYRYSTTGAYFAIFKIKDRQTRVNLQTRDLATAKRKRDAEKAKLIKTDQDKRNCTLGEYVKTYLETKSQLAAKTRHR